MVKRSKRNRKGKVSQPVQSSRKIVVQQVQPKRARKRKPDWAGIAGNVLGRSAEYMLGMPPGLISGRGAYTINKNILYDNYTGAPKFVENSRAIRVCHKEYLGDISSSINFSSTQYPINPGMVNTFPWLSTLAANFEQYQIQGMIFYFRSMSAEALNSTNTALGTIIMSTQYDALDTAFGSKYEMENWEYSSSAKPSSDQLHPIECDPRQTTIEHLYVRSGSVPSGADQRLYDLGTFTIASVGSQAAAVVGELWVSYCVDLYKPLFEPGSNLVYSAHYTIPVGGITTSAYFGSSIPSPTSYVSGSNLAITFTNTTMTFPNNIGSGVFLIFLAYQGDAGTLTNTLSMAATTNCSGVAMFGGATNSTQTAGASSCDILFHCHAIKLTAPSAVVTVSGGTMPANLARAILIITQVNNAISS